MTDQRILIPSECPRCDGPTCITDAWGPVALVHCHNTRTDTHCGWELLIPLDPDATTRTFVSVDPDQFEP